MKGISEGIFNGAMAISILALTVGVINGHMEGKPFSTRATVKFLGSLMGRTQRAADYASGRDKPKGPILQEIEESVSSLREELGERRERLSTGLCENKRTETNRKERLPISQKEKLSKNRERMRTIWDFQSLLGQPNCIDVNTWTYYFEDMSTLIIQVNEKSLDIKMTEGY